MAKYLVGIDLGTTGTKSVVFDTAGKVVGVGYLDTPTQFPRPGWVSQDPNQVLATTFESTKLAIKNSGIDPAEIVGVGFTHMCTSFVPVDKDMNFLYSIFLWNDLRGIEMNDEVRRIWEENGITEQEDYEYTGYPLGGLCSLQKILWFKKHHPDLYERTDKFVWLQGLLTWAYTGGEPLDDKPGLPYTKVANAATFELDPERIEMYGLDPTKYTRRVDPGTLAGTVSKEAAEKSGLVEGTPVYVGAGDQRCAAVGAGVAKDGMLSMTFGTAGVCHAFTSEYKTHPEGKISILGHAGTGAWQVEGNSSAGASSLQWFSDTFSQLETAWATESGHSVFQILTEKALDSPAGARGLIWAPWLAGADCPNYDGNATGTLIGLTFSHKKSDVIRAVLEGVCYETLTMIQAAEETLGYRPEVVRAIGGGAKSPIWNQIQADVYNRRIETVESAEATALAAAMFAGIGADIFADVHEAIDNMVHVKDTFEPNPDNVEIYEDLMKVYRDMYQSLKGSTLPMLKQFQDQRVQ